MYEVRFTKRFEKQFRKLDRQIQKKIIEETEILKTKPEVGEPLHGALSDFRKLRVHDYRVIYRLHSSNTMVEVCFVDHRKRVYEELDRLRREETI
ncbi:type II toxin-antitoxin system RelE/ParE family toxin [Candidatus Bathyarchaeota archaeon]|nr:type II toxin-antitoxin system RelE/ParE family toxin [Candidatus Bathyarchaeota archaeon]